MKRRQRARIDCEARVALIAAVLICGAAGASGPTARTGSDWPHWAGPNRDGSTSAGGVFEAPFELLERWRRPVGKGISALAVAGGRVITLENGEVHGEEPDAVFALDAETGEELWRVALGVSPPGQFEFGVPSTPATDGRWAVVLDSACHLYGLEAATGKVAWHHDLRAEYAAGPLSQGCWTSPLLDGDRLIAQVNGEPDKRVMAFDLASGAVLWTSPGVHRAVLSSPSLVTLGGVRQILVHDVYQRTSGLYALRLEDGQLLWSFSAPQPDPKVIVGSFSGDLPFGFGGDRVAVPTWDQLVTATVRREDDTFSVESGWITDEVRAGGNPVNLHVVAHGDYLYGFGGEHLRCLDAATGRSVWSEKIYPGSVIVVDAHLVVLSQAAGLLRIVEATPAGYREKARHQTFTPGAPTDTPPGFAGGRLYLRNADEIVVLEPVRKSEP